MSLGWIEKNAAQYYNLIMITTIRYFGIKKGRERERGGNRGKERQRRKCQHEFLLAGTNFIVMNYSHPIFLF